MSCTPGRLRPSKASTPSGSRSMWSAWLITRSGARRGRKRWTFSTRPDGRRRSAPPIGRRRPSYERALDALRHLPQQPKWQERAIDLHLDASRVMMILGERAKSVDHARQAKALAESLGDERRLVRALVALAILT